MFSVSYFGYSFLAHHEIPHQSWSLSKSSWKWKITLYERTLILEGPIFHFHDYRINSTDFILLVMFFLWKATQHEEKKKSKAALKAAEVWMQLLPKKIAVQKEKLWMKAVPCRGTSTYPLPEKALWVDDVPAFLRWDMDEPFPGDYCILWSRSSDHLLIVFTPQTLPPKILCSALIFSLGCPDVVS